ncbi:bacteriohemerythrin [Thiocapsa roseopersicina]|uniref:Methyl-accepting chemotaxis protein/hemerythrin n=1 Tax=Thiocapsa roseopersicina TaxID=1058 RepID=A0A1H3BZJ4_THIRO|nr:hemerythrin domain-containing protein [Thiocapsa roseopersicina]SDX46814.1 methyl-accepting chemotaxis protein/hemerythrin [Thiocapsa roseopersicina]
MTRLLTWHDEWSLNIDVLDEEHRGLIEHLADICHRFGPEASPRRSGDACALIDALTDLGEAVREHFKREEELMQTVGYEDVAEHRTEHALLMAEYTDQLRHWRAEGIDVFHEEAQEDARDWILDHILGADRDFAKAFHEIEDHLTSAGHCHDVAARARLNAARRYP